jgi:hypothetical protein
MAELGRAPITVVARCNGTKSRFGLLILGAIELIDRHTVRNSLLPRRLRDIGLHQPIIDMIRIGKSFSYR